jgi:hypothetical protein
MNVQHTIYFRAFAEFSILIEDQKVCEPTRYCKSYNLLHVIRATRIVVHVGNNSEKVFKEVEHLTRGLPTSGNHDPWCFCVIEMGSKLVIGILVANFVIGILHISIVLDALILDSFWN